MPLLQVIGLSKTYENGTDANLHIDLSLNAGETLCLMGPNGAGKTTLVRQVAGLLRPTAGDIWVGDIHVNAHPRRAKEVIGYQPQHLHGLNELTLGEALYYFGRLKRLSRQDTREAIAQLEDEFALRESLRSRVGHLSGGMRKLLSLCIALLAPVKLLVLDEPTAGLDPVHRRLVWSRLAAARADETAAMIMSHNLAEMEEQIDHYGILSQGRLLRHGPVTELQSDAEDPGSTQVRIFAFDPPSGDVREQLVTDGFEIVSDPSDKAVRVRCRVDDLPSLFESLNRHGIMRRARRIQIQHETLEEFYLSLVGREEAS
ncbi:MAG: ABC transporter ATP-binding protein [Candidatus Bipolaricaulia bacterium]